MEIQDFAPAEPADRAYAMVAALSLERLGYLFQFLDQHLGEVAIFDPDAKVRESMIRDALKVGQSICSMLRQDAERAGVSPAPLGDCWSEIVDLAVVRRAISGR